MGETGTLFEQQRRLCWFSELGGALVRQPGAAVKRGAADTRHDFTHAPLNDLALKVPIKLRQHRAAIALQIKWQNPTSISAKILCQLEHWPVQQHELLDDAGQWGERDAQGAFRFKRGESVENKPGRGALCITCYIFTLVIILLSVWHVCQWKSANLHVTSWIHLHGIELPVYHIAALMNLKQLVYNSFNSASSSTLFGWPEPSELVSLLERSRGSAAWSCRPRYSHRYVQTSHHGITASLQTFLHNSANIWQQEVGCFLWETSETDRRAVALCLTGQCESPKEIMHKLLKRNTGNDGGGWGRMKDAMFLFPCCHYLFYGVCVWQLLIEMSIRNVFFFFIGTYPCYWLIFTRRNRETIYSLSR